MTETNTELKPRRPRLLPGIAGLLILSLLGTSIGLYFTTRVNPVWPTGSTESISPRPGGQDPPFHREPPANTFSERQQLYIAWGAELPTPEGPESLWAELLKVEEGARAVSGTLLYQLLDNVELGQEDSFVVVPGLIRYYYGYLLDRQDSPHAQTIEKALLNLQYSLTEQPAKQGNMELWTEHQQILSFTSEYLAGQLFPHEVFTARDASGREGMLRARANMIRWMDWRVRTGFAQWDSPYQGHILAALLNLVDFAQDDELVSRAAMMVDLILFDMAVDSYYGHYATSSGRADSAQVRSAAGDSLVTAQAVLWGLGRFQSNSSMASVSLALTRNYQLPPVLEAIAWDMPEVMINLERHSLDVTDQAAEKWGIQFGPEDADLWWALGAFTHPKVIDTTVTLAHQWKLMKQAPFREFALLGRTLQRLNLLPQVSRWLKPDANGSILSQVNKITYRTPDYILSNAQDWRKGEQGNLQQIWQAALDPYAVVFVRNPGGPAENYWAGQGRLPRTAQFKNTLVVIHDIPAHRGLMEDNLYGFTHAYFPQWAFDEVKEVPAQGGGGWIFGRKGEGYIALYSHLPYQWQKEGPEAGQEIIALGRQNIWLVQMGRTAVDGQFADFIQAVSKAPLEIKGLNVTWAAPGTGTIRFDWDGPLMVDNLEVPLRGYPRWENPYTRAEFGSTKFTISHNGQSLELDFDQLIRTFD